MTRPYLAAAASIALASVVELQLAPSAFAVAAEPEEIVVTVRRKEESLQEVPLAVTAISLDEIEKRGIKNLAGIATLDPSVVIDQGFSAEDTRIAIRGITNTRGRSNVAFLVDGVDVTSESISTAGSSLLVSQRLLTFLCQEARFTRNIETCKSCHDYSDNRNQPVVPPGRDELRRCQTRRLEI